MPGRMGSEDPNLKPYSGCKAGYSQRIFHDSGMSTHRQVTPASSIRLNDRYWPVAAIRRATRPIPRSAQICPGWEPPAPCATSREDPRWNFSSPVKTHRGFRRPPVWGSFSSAVPLAATSAQICIGRGCAEIAKRGRLTARPLHRHVRRQTRESAPCAAVIFNGHYFYQALSPEASSFQRNAAPPSRGHTPSRVCPSEKCGP